MDYALGVYALILSLFGNGQCNEFTNAQRIIASENPYQSFDAQIATARAARDKGLCMWIESYWSGMRVAREQYALGHLSNHHVRAYFDLYSFSASERESWAIASYLALTEYPPIHVAHIYSESDGVDDYLCPHGHSTSNAVHWC